MLIDTHTHVNSEQLSPNADQIIAECLAKEIWMVNIGTDFQSSKQAIELAEKNDEGVYASIGVHPTGLPDESFNFENFKELAKSSSKVVAIGETGLDYYRLKAEEDNTEIINQQKNTFRSCIRLANELDLALVVHLRSADREPHKAYDDALEILKEEKARRGVIHCYGGDVEHAQRFVELGFNLGITGIVTFKNALTLQNVVRMIPLEHLIIETDAPYLAPEPVRGSVNTPSNVVHIAAKMAELRGDSVERISEETTINARRMYVI